MIWHRGSYTRDRQCLFPSFLRDAEKYRQPEMNIFFVLLLFCAFSSFLQPYLSWNIVILAFKIQQLRDDALLNLARNIPTLRKPDRLGSNNRRRPAMLVFQRSSSTRRRALQRQILHPLLCQKRSLPIERVMHEHRPSTIRAGKTKLHR